MNGFEFFAQYWWLVFPIGFGAMAFIGRLSGAESRRDARKHQQKLERLDAQRRLAEAQNGTVAAVTAAPTEATTHASQLSQLIDLFGTHDEVTARWLDYELDVAKLIEYPAMSDGRQPLTAAFLRAKRTADTLRPARVDADVTPEQLQRYAAAVAEYGAAFDIAESDARRVRDAGFTADERARLARASTLLAVATDESATAAERQVAYRRVRTEIDGLIAVSPESMSILESKVGREITP